MNKTDLLYYDAPWYTEYVSWDWLQTLVAKRMASRITKKLARYEIRKQRAKYFSNPQTSLTNSKATYQH